jgi:hypothetical protein
MDLLFDAISRPASYRLDLEHDGEVTLGYMKAVGAFGQEVSLQIVRETFVFYVASYDPRNSFSVRISCVQQSFRTYL